MKKILTAFLLSIAAFSCGGNSNIKDEKVAYFNAVAEGKSFDPQQLTDGFTMNIHAFITEGLTETNPKGEVLPKQAKSWDISEDGLTWTFHLRDDIKWSDGSDVVAEDFVYGWQRALTKEVASEYAFILFPIKNAEKYSKGEVSLEEFGAKAIDSKTLEVKLENVTPYFDSLVSFITYMPAKKEFVEKQGSNYALEKENLLYNGAFILNDWKHNEKLELIKNENYYDKDKIKLDKILIKYIKDENSQLNAFNNEELDFAKLGSEQVEKYLNDKRLKEISLARTTYIAFNVQNEIFKNENIRKAFGLSFDRDMLVKSVFNNLKNPLYTLTPKGAGILGEKDDFSTELGEVFPKYNKDKANEYLEIGLKELNLKELPKLTLLIDDRYSYNRKISEIIQENIRTTLGIDIDVEVVTFKERLARVNSDNFEFLLTAWGADYQDPMTFLDLLASFNGNNASNFNNKNYDKLIELATKSVDRVKRINYLKDAEKMLAEEMPIVPLYQEKDYYLFNDKLTNVELSAFSPLVRIINSDKIK